MTKEYIVSLKKDVDYDQFWSEIEGNTSGLSFIPNRSVDIVNNRDGSLRSCHYALTEEEAEVLRNDPRVYGVEIPPDQRTDIQLEIRARQSSNFTKTILDTGNYVNWGLVRINAATNIYGTGSTTSEVYKYILDGTGVDVVIHDSGLEVGHPEFQDVNGVSRVQQIDWYTASGISGTQSANHYRDYDGHGTHVAGIVAGKTYGWAKNARIYSIKVNGLEGSGDSGTGIPIADCFDVIKLWHRSKPVDPVTGYKRPTIVNMSWGYGTYMTNITGGSYRGVPWSGTSRDTSKGMVGTSTIYGYRHGVRISSVDSDLQELLDEGVHVCIAAGNSYQKIDISGGVDYDNYWTSSLYGDVYYHRGGSPYNENAMIVGNLDSTPYSSSLEQKNVSSECGPGVNIWAPGTDIMSAASQINRFTSGSYFLNTAWKQMNITGTSMASPQIAGLGAIYLQANPGTTPLQLQTWLAGNAKTDTLYSTGQSADYTNNRSIQSSPLRVAYNPLNQDTAFTVSGAITFSNVGIRS